MLNDDNIINVDEVATVTFNKDVYKGTNNVLKYIEFLKYKEIEEYGKIISTDDISEAKGLYPLDQFGEYIATKESKDVVSNYIIDIEYTKMKIVLKNGFAYLCRYFNTDGDILFDTECGYMKYISNEDIKTQNKRYSRIKKVIFENTI